MRSGSYLGAAIAAFVLVWAIGTATAAVGVSQAATLTLSEGPNNPSDGKVAPQAEYVPLLQIVLEASAAESIAVDSLRVGLRSSDYPFPSIDSAFVVDDANGNGEYEPDMDHLLTSGVFEPPGEHSAASLSISPPLVVPGQEEVTLLFLTHVPSGAQHGATFRAAITARNVVGAIGITSGTAPTLDGESSVSGGEWTIDAVGEITLAAGNNSPGSRFVGHGAVGVPVLQLTVTATQHERVLLDSIALTMVGTMHHGTGITRIGVYDDTYSDGQYDSETDMFVSEVSIEPATHDSAFTARVLMGLLPWGKIDAGETRTYWVVVDVSADAVSGATFGVRIAGNDSVLAVGRNSEEPVTVVGAPVTSALMTVASTGTLTLDGGYTADGSLGPGTMGAGLLRLDMQASAMESIAVERLTLKLTGTLDDAAWLDSVWVVHNVNGDRDYDAGVDSMICSSKVPVLEDNGVASFELSPPFIIPPGETRNVLFLVDVGESPPDGATLSGRIVLNDYVEATGVTTGESIVPVVTLPMSGGEYVIDNEGTLVVAVGPSSPGNRTVEPGTVGVEMIQLQFSTGPVETLLVSRIGFLAVGSGNEPEDVSASDMWADVNSNGVVDEGVDSLVAKDVVFTADNGLLEFRFEEGIPLPPSISRDFIVTHDFAADVADGSWFRLWLVLSSHVDVTSIGGQSRPVVGAPVGGPVVTVSDVTGALGSNLPTELGLSQNSPNPFNPRTSIRFAVPSATHARLAVYDLNGRLVRTLVDRGVSPGRYEITWDGTDNAGRPAASGMFLYRLVTDDTSLTRRMLLVR